MQGNRFVIALQLHGTLAANAQGVFKMPCNATLEEVSAAASNASGATIQLGHNAAATGIMTAKPIGGTNAPIAYGSGAFDGTAMPVAPAATPMQRQATLKSLAKGDNLTWVLDFDGAAGTPAANVTILFSFLEG